MALALSEINSTLLKERLKNGQNCTENAPLGTPDGLILRTRLKKVVEAETLAYYISPHKDCVQIFSEIGRPSFPSLPRSLRQRLLSHTSPHTGRQIFFAQRVVIPF